VSILDKPLSRVALALRNRDVSALELVEEAIRRHHAYDRRLQAYKLFDEEGARAGALRADAMIEAARRAPADGAPPPMCGIPVSVKDLYGMEGLPTYAGTSRPLPEAWSRDAWLVARLRAQGAVFVGKTHTVELAYGAVGVNPHWATPRNPWDDATHRIPGGSSAGAGVSLWEGSALVALGSDTGGSVRIPASLTGTVGHKTTKGRWPTNGVVQLSSTLDTVGALTRSVADSVHFFGAVDPEWGDPRALLEHLGPLLDRPPRVAVPSGRIWEDCQGDVAAALRQALDELGGAGWSRVETDGRLLDAAGALYLGGGIPGAELKDFLARELPGWMEILHPIVRNRLEPVPPMAAASYRHAMEERARLVARAGSLFDGVDVLAIPTAILTPPPVAEVEPLERYLATNRALLTPTCPIGMLGLCAVSLPVGLDRAGMPVGLQLVGKAGADAELLGVALAAERVLGFKGPALSLSPRASAWK
jgi:aspartyl-tRNA(Asn)/glutamyl-tRNA(Gln) amidotransferase subunit A